MSLYVPGRLWEYVPAHIDAWDTSWAQTINHLFHRASPLIQGIKRLTEGDAVYLRFVLGTCLVVFMFWLWKHRAARWQLSTIARFWSVAVFTVAFAGLGDGLSNLIKKVVGRLKPDILSYDPNVAQAFSFPSSHVVNQVFTLSLLWFSFNPEQRREWRWLFRAGFLLATLVSFSRVLVGQHYPLDVLAGILIAISFALLMRKPYLAGRSFLLTWRK